jgi:hypothetical protein
MTMEQLAAEAAAFSRDALVRNQTIAGAGIESKLFRSWK